MKPYYKVGYGKSEKVRLFGTTVYDTIYQLHKRFDDLDKAKAYAKKVGGVVETYIG